MAAGPTLFLLRYLGLATVYLGPYGEAAVANSYFAAQIFAVARVFFGFTL